MSSEGKWQQLREQRALDEIKICMWGPRTRERGASVEESSLKKHGKLINTMNLNCTLFLI